MAGDPFPPTESRRLGPCRGPAQRPDRDRGPGRAVQPIPITNTVVSRGPSPLQRGHPGLGRRPPRPRSTAASKEGLLGPTWHTWQRIAAGGAGLPRPPAPQPRQSRGCAVSKISPRGGRWEPTNESQPGLGGLKGSVQHTRSGCAPVKRGGLHDAAQALRHQYPGNIYKHPDRQGGDPQPLWRRHWVHLDGAAPEEDGVSRRPSASSTSCSRCRGCPTLGGAEQ